MGKRARKGARAAAETRRHTETASESFAALGQAGRSASRRERGATRRDVRLTVALDQDEAAELRARASALGVSVSRLLVESAMENLRLATAKKPTGEASIGQASEWKGGDWSTHRIRRMDALEVGDRIEAHRHMESAIDEELADRYGTRPPWLAKILPDERLAAERGARTATAWSSLSRRIARKRIEREITDPKDHGLRQTDKRIWLDIKELSYALALPNHLETTRVRLSAEHVAGGGAAPAGANDEPTTEIEDADGQLRQGVADR